MQVKSNSKAQPITDTGPSQAEWQEPTPGIAPRQVAVSDEIMEQEERAFTEEQEQLHKLHLIIKELDPRNAPLTSELEAWKSKFGQLYTSTVVGDQYYIWRTLKRLEYKQLANAKIFDDEDKSNEVIVEKCLLYPIPTQRFRVESPAGVITTLARQISYQSGFISPEETLAFIRVL